MFLVLSTGVDIMLKHATIDIGESDLPNDLKITNVDFDTTNVANEAVTLLLERQLNLTGHQVEYHDGTDWQPFYTFADEEPMLAGTLFRISSGQGNNLSQDGIETRYAGRTASILSGLSNLRLVDAEGVSSHRRMVLPIGDFNDVSSDVTVLRKADGTGLMMYVANMQQGTHRLHMRYHLSLDCQTCMGTGKYNQTTCSECSGSGKYGTLFKKHGLSTMEEACIDIPWAIINDSPKQFLPGPILVPPPSMGGSL